MIIYRLAVEKYSSDLSGAGAKLYGGRWNNKGLAMLYTTENISLSVLEILVNANRNEIPPAYELLKLNIANTVGYSTITKEKLKEAWKDDFEYTQWIGTAFLKENKKLLLKVPSAVVDDEYNFLVNPNHSDFKKLKIEAASHFKFDKRLHLTP
jgi:RES domain-containing protein